MVPLWSSLQHFEGRMAGEGNGSHLWPSPLSKETTGKEHSSSSCFHNFTNTQRKACVRSPRTQPYRNLVHHRQNARKIWSHCWKNMWLQREICPECLEWKEDALHYWCVQPSTAWDSHFPTSLMPWVWLMRLFTRFDVLQSRFKQNFFYEINVATKN